VASRPGPTTVAARARARSAVAGLLSAQRNYGTPGRWGGGGAHPNYGTAERRRRGLGAAAFIGGEGSPMVASVVEEVLQLGRGEGVRKLQEIPGIGSSGKSLPGRGGRRQRSAEIREGESGSGGRRRWSGCGEWRGGSSAQESGRRGVKIRFLRSSARRNALGGSAAGRGKRGGERGSRPWGCHAARGSSWGPVPTGMRRRQQPARGAGGRRAPRAHVRSETELERDA
jgi:hypothetical protein